MEKILSEMFEDGMFSNIFYAEENPAIIKVEKTIKEDGKLKTITDSNKFNLSSLYANSDDDIKYQLTHNFFVRLNFQSTVKEIKYFNRGFFRNLFTKRDQDTILDEVLNYNWIITTSDIIKEISMMEGYQKCDGNTLVKLKGRFNYQFNDTLIFEIPSVEFTKDVVYCGNFDSITPVINRNKIVEKDGIRIEYIFQTKDNLKKLIIT
jgi:hypothetical protein